MATDKYKIFNDSVHGHITMHPLLVQIIDTPEFQRLRNIKQLGGGYFVFPGASHNRFEHSIGVAHLAGKLVQSLRAQGNDITEKDELCVQIAGLCHDLGHGPFSHLFEVFMKKVKPELKWKHEKESVKMFEQLITKNIGKNNKTIKKIMEDDHNLEKHDIKFIKELIYSGERLNSAEDTKETETEKRDKQRRKDNPYLYEIVANERTGIDVDKMDYFSRDCLHLGMKSNFSHERYVMFARVSTNAEGEKQICMRDKEALNMYELFHVRYLLHHNAYQHRVTVAVEMMIVDALAEAEKDFEVVGRKISDDVNTPETYLKLTDNILQEIKGSSENAKEIINRIEKRDLYSFVDSRIFKPKELKVLNDPKQQMENVKEKVESWLKCIQKPNLSETDFRVRLIKIDYGKEGENPIDSLRFYRKDEKDKGVKLLDYMVSYIKPEVFHEIKVMLFCTKKLVPGLSMDDIEKFWGEMKNTNEQPDSKKPKLQEDN
ncbi:deoxynucleoside triphosphate triphosphohydrolase SAMHD1 isoform X2 [Ictalurus furcatus]|nr:deoxynucleoside triphosphate triphosphohydrolase SAMHD1 isoform X2 [Ictalurus furcatus]